MPPPKKRAQKTYRPGPFRDDGLMRTARAFARNKVNHFISTQLRAALVRKQPDPRTLVALYKLETILIHERIATVFDKLVDRACGTDKEESEEAIEALWAYKQKQHDQLSLAWATYKAHQVSLGAKSVEPTEQELTVAEKERRRVIVPDHNLLDSSSEDETYLPNDMCQTGPAATAGSDAGQSSAGPAAGAANQNPQPGPSGIATTSSAPNPATNPPVITTTTTTNPPVTTLSTGAPPFQPFGQTTAPSLIHPPSNLTSTAGTLGSLQPPVTGQQSLFVPPFNPVVGSTLNPALTVPSSTTAPSLQPPTTINVTTPASTSASAGPSVTTSTNQGLLQGGVLPDITQRLAPQVPPVDMSQFLGIDAFDDGSSTTSYTGGIGAAAFSLGNLPAVPSSINASMPPLSQTGGTLGPPVVPAVSLPAAPTVANNLTYPNLTTNPPATVPTSAPVINTTSAPAAQNDQQLFNQLIGVANTYQARNQPPQHFARSTGSFRASFPRRGGFYQQPRGANSYGSPWGYRQPPPGYGLMSSAALSTTPTATYMQARPLAASAVLASVAHVPSVSTQTNTLPGQPMLQGPIAPQAQPPVQGPTVPQPQGHPQGQVPLQGQQPLPGQQHPGLPQGPAQPNVSSTNYQAPPGQNAPQWTYPDPSQMGPQPPQDPWNQPWAMGPPSFPGGPSYPQPYLAPPWAYADPTWGGPHPQLWGFPAGNRFVNPPPSSFRPRSTIIRNDEGLAIGREYYDAAGEKCTTNTHAAPHLPFDDEVLVIPEGTPLHLVEALPKQWKYQPDPEADMIYQADRLLQKGDIPDTMVPVFYGQPSSYRKWRGDFVEVIHRSGRLGVRAKYNVLAAKLGDNIREDILCREDPGSITDYVEAICRLEEFFGDPKLIQESILTDFKQHRFVSANDLRAFYEFGMALRTMIRQLDHEGLSRVVEESTTFDTVLRGLAPTWQTAFQQWCEYRNLPIDVRACAVWVKGKLRYLRNTFQLDFATLPPQRRPAYHTTDTIQTKIIERDRFLETRKGHVYSDRSKSNQPSTSYTRSSGPTSGPRPSQSYSQPQRFNDGWARQQRQQQSSQQAHVTVPAETLVTLPTQETTAVEQVDVSAPPPEVTDQVPAAPAPPNPTTNQTQNQSALMDPPDYYEQSAVATFYGTPTEANCSTDKGVQFKVQRQPNDRSVCPACKGEGAVTDGGRHFPGSCPLLWRLTPAKVREIVVANALCYRCLKFGHAVKNCYTTRPCGENGCNGRHHRLLHEERPTEPKPEVPTAIATSIFTGVAAAKSSVSLLTIPVRVINNFNGNSLIVFAALDSCAAITYLDEDFAKFMGFKGLETSMRVAGVAGMATTLQGQQVSIQVQALDKTFNAHIPAFATASPCPTYRAQQWDRIRHHWDHLAKIDLPPSPDDRRCPLLIGTDNAYLLAALAPAIKGKSTEPVAQRTALGWAVMGPCGPPEGEEIEAYPTYKAVPMPAPPVHPDDLMNAYIKKLYDYETSGTPSAMKRVRVSEKDQAALDHVRKHRRINEEGKVEVPITWLPGCPDFTSNRAAAKKVAMAFTAAREKDNTNSDYNKVLLDLHSKGYIEECFDEDPDEVFLNTFLVHRPDKTSTPIRFITNAAGLFDGKSLNSQINSGPDMIQDISTLLLNFRKYPWTYCSDVSKMFYNVHLPKRERKFTRFWWKYPKDGDAAETRGTWKCFQYKGHFFGKSDSPFLVIYVSHDQAFVMQDTHPLGADAILHHSMVDDVTTSLQTLADLHQTHAEVGQIFSTVGMRIHKIASSSRSFMKTVPAEDRAKSNTFEGWEENDDTESPLIKVLGLIWDTQQDVFGFAATSPKVEQWSKTECLSLVMSIFDPLGFLGPVLATGRQLFQQLWRLREPNGDLLKWKTTLSDEYQAIWKEFASSLELLKDVKIPRCLTALPPPEVDNESLLHYRLPIVDQQVFTFSDASETGYAAVALIRTTYKDQEPTRRFVISKQRVAPLKQISLPKLELMAAQLAVRMTLGVCAAIQFPPEKVTFLMDNAAVIHWIKGSKPLQKFQGNRVAEMLEVFDPQQFVYVKSADNIADLATRPIATKDFIAKLDWWLRGPEFLELPRNQWPQLQMVVPKSALEGEAPDQFCNTIRQAFSMHASVPTPRERYFCALNPDRFKSLHKVIKAMWQFKRSWALMRRQPYPKTFTPGDYLAERDAVIKHFQYAHYRPEIVLLQKGSPAVSMKSPLASCSPVLDTNGVLRYGGRLRNVSWLPVETRHPALIPPDSVLALWIVRDAHERDLNHAGSIKAIMTEVKKAFHIPKLRKTARLILATCPVCIRRRATPIQPSIAPLHSWRYGAGEHLLRPFERIGLDLGGPYKLRQDGRQARHKRWFLCISCCITRAVHLEVVHSSNASDFIMAFARFICRRGQPVFVNSDGAGNFIRASADLELPEGWMQECTKSMREKWPSLHWDINPAQQSSYGGHYERKIGAVKNVFNQRLGKEPHDLTDDEFQTLCVMTESFLNMQPLLDVSESLDHYDTLSPAHFLLGCAKTLDFVFPGEHQITDAHSLAMRWRYIQKVMDDVWARWRDEYLPTLRPDTKWSKTPERQLEPGELVLVMDKTTRRSDWVKGRILREEGSSSEEDGEARTFIVRLQGGQEFKRSARQLIPLLPGRATLNEIRKIYAAQQNKFQELWPIFQELDPPSAISSASTDPQSNDSDALSQEVKDEEQPSQEADIQSGEGTPICQSAAQKPAGHSTETALTQQEQPSASGNKD